MNKETIDKIKAEIYKSGFPLELELTEKLRLQERTIVFSNVAFQNEEKVIRELDIVAILQDEENEWDIGPVATQLLIECKKSDKYPWVFFEEVYDPLSLLGLVYRADHITDLNTNLTNAILMSCAHTKLNQHYYNNIELPKARTYFEAFKTSNDSTIFKAVMNILHGRKYLKELFIKQFGKKENVEKFRTFLKQYVIVLDGQLLLATKTENDFQLSETGHIILRARDTISNIDNDYLGDEILIDVITREYFETYIDLSRRGVSYFNNHLKSIKDSENFKSFIDNKKSKDN